MVAGTGQPKRLGRDGASIVGTHRPEPEIPSRFWMKWGGSPNASPNAAGKVRSTLTKEWLPE